MVDIHDGDREGRPLAHAVVPRDREGLVEAAPVPDPRESVGERQVLEVVAMALQLDVGADPSLDDGRIEGFLDVVDRSRVESLDLVLVVRHPGDEDDGDVGGLEIGLESPARVQAGGPRHRDVEEDQVGLILRVRHLDGGFARSRHPHGELVHEEIAEDLDAHRLVVHDEDSVFFIVFEHGGRSSVRCRAPRGRGGNRANARGRGSFRGLPTRRCRRSLRRRRRWLRSRRRRGAP